MRCPLGGFAMNELPLKFGVEGNLQWDGQAAWLRSGWWASCRVQVREEDLPADYVRTSLRVLGVLACPSVTRCACVRPRGQRMPLLRRAWRPLAHRSKPGPPSRHRIDPATRKLRSRGLGGHGGAAGVRRTRPALRACLRLV